MQNKITAVLDRIEGQRAVFLVEDKDSFEFPVELLPQGVKEGDILSFILKKENKKRKARKILQVFRADHIDVSGGC